MHLHDQPVPLWKQLRDQGRVSPDHLLSFFGVRAPPVDVTGIARQLGVVLHHVPNPGWFGAVSSTDDHAEIWISTNQSGVKQRFTLAHELGHLLQHPLAVAYRDLNYEPGTSSIEREANHFAACLLMPAWMMGAAMHSTGGSVHRMAHLFDVSESAMSFRLRNLGLR
jgi:Zn-dependent peptidase ImmA (M78 family)